MAYLNAMESAYILGFDGIATEGFFTHDIVEENIDKLATHSRGSLFVLAQDDIDSYIIKITKKYLSEFKYKSYKIINMNTIEEGLLMDKEFNSTGDKYVDGYMKKSVDGLLKMVSNEDEMHLNVIRILVDRLNQAAIEASKKTNILYIIYTDFHKAYSIIHSMNYPFIITNGSVLQKTITGFKLGMDDRKKFKNHYTDKALHNMTKVPYSEAKYMKLYHVSPNHNLTELEPRITSKPMKFENHTIKRISVANNIKNCMQAIDGGDKGQQYMVYQIIIDKNTKIVKPSKDIVEDADETGEYWILNNVRVKPIKKIISK